jgi:hypothetical protein
MTMVLLASEFDRSRFLKAADLESEKKFRIKAVAAEEVGEKKERKPILWFTNDERGLVLNKTNLRTLSGAYGDTMDAWIGKIIVVFPTRVESRGQMVPALRVRIPPPKQATGNGHTAAKPTPPKPSVPADPELEPDPKPSVANDMDDEIPF